MSLLTLSTNTDFQKRSLSKNLFVVHFTADWASQCQQMDDVLLELGKRDDLKDVIMARILAEDIPEVSQKFNITAVPTILILREGKILERVNGANAAELTSKLETQTAKALLLSNAAPSTQTLNERLEQLISSHKCIVFMKGSPEEPRCGFSRTLVDILKKNSADYKFFDILTDDEIRQGLKAYSNWPTYPQLYVDGELIGGLDILKEMDSSSELANILPKKISLDERLKDLVNESPLMIFMKGTPAEPRCGFSKQLMEILKETGQKFETFNILADDEVRQELKKFSNWPTYPQIYVKGELVGGLDIIKDLKADGSLDSILQGE